MRLILIMILMFFIIGCELIEKNPEIDKWERARLIDEQFENEKKQNPCSVQPYIDLELFGYGINGSLLINSGPDIRVLDFDFTGDHQSRLFENVLKCGMDYYISYIPPPLTSLEVMSDTDGNFYLENSTKISKEMIIEAVSKSNIVFGSDGFPTNVGGSETRILACMNSTDVVFIKPIAGETADWDRSGFERSCKIHWENNNREVPDYFFKQKWTTRIHSPSFIRCFSAIRQMQQVDSLRMFDDYMYIDPKSDDIFSMMGKCQNIIKEPDEISKDV